MCLGLVCEAWGAPFGGSFLECRFDGSIGVSYTILSLFLSIHTYIHTYIYIYIYIHYFIFFIILLKLLIKK